MNETSNELYNEELNQLVEDLFSELKQAVEAVKVFLSKLGDVLSELISPFVDYVNEKDRIKHNNHTKQSWHVHYDMTRASQVINRKPRLTRKIIR